MFRKLKRLDDDAEKSDYYNSKEWDMAGLRSDIVIAGGTPPRI